MAMPSGKKRALMGATVMAVTLGLSSAAFACTIFRGTFKVTGSAGGTVKATGAGTSMNYCVYPTGTATAPMNGGTITVSLNNNPQGSCPTTKMPKGKYDINFTNGAAHLKSGDRDWQLDCMSGLTGTVRLGGIWVEYGAAPQKTFSLPSGLIPNGPNDESGVCISTPTPVEGTQYGNQVPITIL